MSRGRQAAGGRGAFHSARPSTRSGRPELRRRAQAAHTKLSRGRMETPRTDPRPARGQPRFAAARREAALTFTRERQASGDRSRLPIVPGGGGRRRSGRNKAGKRCAIAPHARGAPRPRAQTRSPPRSWRRHEKPRRDLAPSQVPGPERAARLRSAMPRTTDITSMRMPGAPGPCCGQTPPRRRTRTPGRPSAGANRYHSAHSSSTRSSMGITIGSGQHARYFFTAAAGVAAAGAAGAFGRLMRFASS